MSATAFSLSKALNTSPQFHRNQLAILHSRWTTDGARGAEFRRLSKKLFGNRLACVSSSVASLASGGGGGGGGGEGVSGGGSGGDGDGGELKADPIVVGVDDGSDVIVLDVGGMTCGGCSAKVKRILESQPLVSAASVNHQTKMAIVWPVPEAKVTPNWRNVLGEELAKHLTACGFNSNLRGEAANEGEES